MYQQQTAGGARPPAQGGRALAPPVFMTDNHIQVDGKQVD